GCLLCVLCFFFFFQAEDGIRDLIVTGVQTCALPISVARALAEAGGDGDGVEVTICARDFEIHVDLVVGPGSEARADELEAAFLRSEERRVGKEGRSRGSRDR